MYKVCNYYFNDLIKATKLETINILINEKNYKDLFIYFTRYDHQKSIKILSLYYHELVEKIEKYDRKTYLIVDDYTLDKVLDNLDWS